MRSRRRVLAVVAGVAVASLAAGVAAGSRITSPADAAARKAPPKASYITVPVEHRSLNSQVVTRADSEYEGAVDVKLAGGGPAIVTGLVPKVGAKLQAGKAFLEVTGRPVLALPGVLPMYRGLRPGMRGPDVEQLEQSLEQIGLDPGTVDDEFDSDTSKAIAKLYDRAGYDAPRAGEDVRQAAKSARDEVKSAEDGVKNAQKALQQARKGPGKTAKVQAQNAVNAAARALADAKKSGDRRMIAEAEDQLRLAKAQLEDLLRPRDTSGERRALSDARERLTTAQNNRTTADKAAGTPMPDSELVYFSALPRRIDAVKVERGSKADGVVMSVSGADLILTATVDAVTKGVLRVGMPARLGLDDGQQINGKVQSIKANSEGKFDVVINPGEPTARQFELMRGANVRVTIPVKSTKGKVLAVPVAALSAGPGGESRVEVLRGKRVTLVQVEIGLSAQGYAEVRPVSGSLRVGDQVVVGR